MKIAFVDVSTNTHDVFELATQLAEQTVSDVYLVHFTSPELLKIPASCARVLNEGADAAIVFALAKANQSQSVALVQEKLIDVEVHSGKFVFTAFVFEDEWRTEARLKQVAQEKIGEMLEMAVGIGGGPGSTSSSTPATETTTSSDATSAMGMFSLPPEQPETEPPGESTTGDGRPLF